MNISLPSPSVEPELKPQKEKGGYASLVVFAITALVLAVVVRMWIAAPYIVSGASMIPTFDSWHYLIIDKVSYELLGEPQRGDIIVMKFPYDTSRTFIKRVIGLPGETVEINGTKVTITNAMHPDGLELTEPYIASENQRESQMSITLGEGEYFVLGDNRKASADSRSWGTLPREDIVGRVLVRLFPVSLVSLFPGEARYDE